MLKREENYELLADEVKSYLKRFCYLDSEAKYDIAVLWAFHTNVRTSDDKLAFAETPRLAILSDMPASGKTRLLELVESLSFNGQRVLDPSPAGLLCAINEDNATVGLDEIDLYFGRNGKQAARSIINAGYRTGSFVRHANAKHETFAPMVMAGMGQNFMTNQNLAATKSRSIIIRMDKRPTDAKIDSYRALMHAPIAHRLRDVMTYWGRKNANTISMMWPDMPEGCSDRDADIWSPLLAVGQMLGEQWAERARLACISAVLSESPNDDARPLTPTEMLLDAMSGIFKEGEEKIATSDLIPRLAAKDSSWSRFPSMQAAAQELATMLTPLGITPTKVWVDDRALRGYWVQNILDKIPSTLPPFQVDDAEEDEHMLPLV